MTYFLTSSSCLPDSPALNPANGFVDELRRALPGPCCALFIASDPDNPAHTYRFYNDMPDSFAAIGLPFSHAEVLILCGGHVPTQNRFFQDISLRKRLQNWDGVVVGVSAGSMNCEELVYAPPELEGEAVDPNYVRFFPGLGLTKHMIFPHFQETRYEVVDGLPTLESSLLPDSAGRRFYALVDGSFILGRDGREELRGEAYLIADGVLTQISREGDAIRL